MAGTVSSEPLSNRTATPWHLWPIAVIFLALYGIGAYDFVQTQLGSADYFAAQGYGPAQIAYFTDYPLVPLVFWTVNIVAGLAGGVLLLLRARWSAPVIATAAFAQLCLQVITFGFLDRWAILGPRLSIPDIAVLLITFAVWCYARRLRGAPGNSSR